MKIQPKHTMKTETVRTKGLGKAKCSEVNFKEEEEGERVKNKSW